MTELGRAVDALKAAVRRGGFDKRVSDVVDQFTSYLVLLKSSSPSLQSISKLRSILRRPLVPLYTDLPGPTLQLSSSVLREVIDEKLRTSLNAQNLQLSASWNEVAVALLSGVLDFLERSCDDLSKETTALAFYPTICTLFFYQDTTLTLSPRTRTTAYSLLHDTLFNHSGNQRRLRDHAVLGGSLIGFAISQSKDYLVIEALLNIVGWLIPATHDTDQGRLKRMEFIQDLFGSDRHFSCSQELVDILQYISSSHWEDTAMIIIDALARSDIMFPQPFALDEVNICGKSYPQPTAFDRLHLDRECFLVNVIDKDDVCESLKIPYGHIRSIAIDTSNVLLPEKATVHVDLTASPIMGEVPLDVMAGQSLYLQFEVQREELSRLMEALRRRGIVKLSFLGGSPRINKRKSVGLAHSIQLPGDSSPQSQEPQYEHKVKHVENVYETNFLDDARPTTAPSEPEPQSVQQAPFPTQTRSKPEIQESRKRGGAECAHKAVPRPRPVSKPMKNVAPLLVSSPRNNPAEDLPPPVVPDSVFGRTDEELSELSDESPSNPVGGARLKVHSAKIAKVRLSPDLNLSDSDSLLPMTRRAAKRRLVVDSDEEVQATKVVQRTATVSSNQDTKTMTMSTELGKIPRIYNKHSSISTIEDADHPEMTLPPVLQKPSTPCSNDVLPELVVNTAKPHPSEDAFVVEAQVSPCNSVTTKKLLPEATAKPTSSTKQDSVTRKRAARPVYPSRPTRSSNVSAKLAGTRRKRENMDSPIEKSAPLDVDHPPRKKPRNATGGVENHGACMLTDPLEPSMSSAAFARNAKKYEKKGKVSSPIPPNDVDFDEVPGVGLKGKVNARARAVRGVLKPVPKRPVRQTRANAMRRKNEKLAEGGSPDGISPKIKTIYPEIGTVAGPGPGDRAIEVEPSNNEVTNDLFASFKPESKQNKKADVSTIRNIDAVITENKSSASERNVCPTPRLTKAPWEDPVFIAQYVLPDEVKPLEVSPQEEFPLEPIQDVAPEETCEVLFDDYIEYSTSLKGSEDPILPASSNSPPSPSVPRNPPDCIDIAQDLTTVKGQDSVKDDRVVRVPTNDPTHSAESSKKSSTVLDVSYGTRRQDERSARIRVSEPLVDDVMEILVSKDPAPLPEILSRVDERREQLAVSKHTLARLSPPSVSARQRKPVVSFASPLVTGPDHKDTIFQASSMAHLMPDVRSNNGSVHEIIMQPLKESVLDRAISLVSDDKIESPHHMRKLASNRVRFDDNGLKSSLSPKMKTHPVRPFVQSPRAKNTSGDNNYRSIKSDKGNDIQDVLDVLNDIQNVIVKGITNKFETVNKDVRAKRDELLHEAAEDLRAMADAYGRQLNSFIALEEDYSTYRATMIRHWEDLIKSSEDLQKDLKKAIQEHDRNVSSKTFPKSLLPPHSRFAKYLIPT